MAEELSSQERRALRTGPCEALGCSAECDVFVRAEHIDGFTICTCGHTQWSHREMRVIA